MRVAEFETLLLKHSQQAYSVELAPGEPESICDSKFGGAPYFDASDGGAWPLCTLCERPMDFICQINFNEPPPAVLPIAKWFGLVTFFYCWKCYPWSPSRPGWWVKNYPAPEPGKAVPIAVPAMESKTPKLLSWLLEPKPKPTIPCVVRFEEFTDVPDPEEMELVTDEAGRALLSDDDITDDYFEAAERISGKLKEYGTICGGFSHWVQGMEEEGCKLCSGRLVQLLQIGSEETAGLMWGDAGAVYLRFCPQHTEQIYLFSQCF